MGGVGASCPEPVGGKPVGGEPMGGKPVGGDPVGGKPVGGEPVGAKPAGGDPVGGKPVGGKPAGGDPVGGNAKLVEVTFARPAAVSGGGLVVRLSGGRRSIEVPRGFDEVDLRRLVTALESC